MLNSDQTHKLHIFKKKVCKILNIQIIFSSPYLPHINPTEQIWKSIKRVISTTYIKNQQKNWKTYSKKILHESKKKHAYFTKWVHEYII